MSAQDASPPAPDAVDGDGWEWALVEVFGHRRHAGRMREVERFGTKLLRIDIPNRGDPAAFGWTTHFYGGSALFSVTPATEAACLAANRPYAAPARIRDRSDDWQSDESDPGPDDSEHGP